MASQLAALHVDITAGRGLAPKDRNGLSDPYCKIWLEDEKGVKDKDSKRSTSVIKKTLNPEWGETFRYMLLTKHKVLVIQCWDKDKIGSDFMGEIVIPLSDITTKEKRGWIDVCPKRKSKKKSKISGSLLISVRVEGSQKTKDIKEKQKVARIINKLFGYSYTPLDMLSECNCTMVARTPKFGTLVPTKYALYFFTERKNGKRKADEILWWDIKTVACPDSDSIQITTKKDENKVFKDIADDYGDAVHVIQSTWQEQSVLQRPPTLKKKKKKRFSITVGTAKEEDEDSLDEIADMTDYTEMSDERTDPELEEDEVEFIRETSFDDTPIKSVKPKSFEELRLNEDGTINTGAPGYSTRINFIAKRTVSRKNQGCESLFIKLKECQDVPEQSYGVPNTFVETRVGHQLFISNLERMDKHPVFGEEYMCEVNSNTCNNIVFSLFHKKNKDESGDFIGEVTVPFNEIPLGELIGLKKDFKPEIVGTRRIDGQKSIGRVQIKPVIDSKKQLLISVSQFVPLISNIKDVVIEASIGDKTEKTPCVAAFPFTFDSEFKFGVLTKGGILQLTVLSSDNIIGSISIPVNELNRTSNNAWYEISKGKIQNKNDKSEESEESTKSESTKEESKQMEIKRESSDIQLKKEPSSKSITKDAKVPEIQVKIEPKKGNSKIVLIGGLSLIILLLALIYTFLF
mmetsp:Transcript_39746/g.68145  ORF Transcript_39746/g.68145 Transcript_39746/m.68145 type:complete len:687 (+) Transcript_39746:27-2087(+)